MSGSPTAPGQIECVLLWKLARWHGWSSRVDVQVLASNANVANEKQARDVARNQLASRDFIGYHSGTDEIWLKSPPLDEACQFLRDKCGYTKLQIETTFGDQFGGF